MFVMVGFADRRGKSADADAVASHNRIFCFAVLIIVCHAHGFGIFGSQLEDIADFNSPGNGDCRFSAVRADSALLDFGKVVVFCMGNIAGHIQSGVMIFFFVCAAGKVVQAFQRTVEQYREVFVFQSYRSDVAGLQTTVFGNHSRMDVASQIIGQLGFIDFQIAADE